MAEKVGKAAVAKNVKYVTCVKWGEDGSTELLLAPKAFNGMVAQL